MNYLKLYEEFIDSVQSQIEIQDEISDKTIDDVLSDSFFDDNIILDMNNIYHIKNWEVY
jgi:myosin-crossreactive antigen